MAKRKAVRKKRVWETVLNKEKLKTLFCLDLQARLNCSDLLRPAVQIIYTSELIDSIFLCVTYWCVCVCLCVIQELTNLGKPKRPRSPFNIFMSEHFEEARGMTTQVSNHRTITRPVKETVCIFTFDIRWSEVLALGEAWADNLWSSADLCLQHISD